MMKFSVVAAVVAALSLSACASSTTTRMAQNIVRIDVSAAPACGSSGAQKVVNKMAAVETIRLGYDRYSIAAMDAQNNVRVVGSNYSTSGTMSAYGNMGTFNSTTTSSPIIAGSRDASVVVVMFNKGDPEGRNAIDARSALGTEWEAVVAEGAPNTCT